jgi:hypothetical protein
MLVVLRTILVVLVSAAVQAAALRAPLVHAHVDDHDAAHHDGRTVHAHLAPHVHADAPHGLAVETAADERTIFLQSFVAVRTAAPDAPAVATASFDLVVPAEGARRRAPDAVHGHDPPPLRARPSRAPPAFLS